MRKCGTRDLRGALGALLVLALAGSAHAHGGNHGLPFPGIPKPGGSTPPAPVTGGAPSPSPTGGQVPSSTGGSPSVAGLAASTGGPAVTGGEDLTSWVHWWRFNADPFLGLKSALFAGQVDTGDADFFLGRGQAQGPGPGPRPTEAVLVQRVVPALLHSLEKEPQSDVKTGSMIALARIGDDVPGELGDAIERAILPLCADAAQEVSETAFLCLGILGRERSAPLLAQVLADDEAGRKRVGGKRVPARTRAFAAYALGLIGHTTANDDVKRYAALQIALAFAGAEDGDADLEVGCVLAMGLVALPESGVIEGAAFEELSPSRSREAQIRWLLEILRDERRHRYARAQAPVSLAKLLDGMDDAAATALREQVADELVHRIGSRSRESNEVFRGAIVALGHLGDDDGDAVDEKIRAALIDAGDATRDQLARGLALVAVGRVAGRRGIGPAHGRPACTKHLARELVRGNTLLRPWAALALGVYARGLIAAGEDVPEDVASALLANLDDASAPEAIGAGALAVGMLGATEGGPKLLRQLARVRDDQARGYVAVALGLLGDRAAIEPLQEVISESRYHPLLLREAAVALGLLRDTRAVTQLVEMLGQTKSLATQASVASALAKVGDARAIDPLLGVLEDQDVTALARAFAAIAVGHVCDLDPLPWSASLSSDSNYASGPATLYSGAGGGVLNIL